MQDEINAEYPELNIQLLAIGRTGGDSGLSGMADSGDLPLFVDNDVENVWDDWGVTLRDVVILNEHNQQVAVFNLSTFSLSTPENYATLKALLIDTAD